MIPELKLRQAPVQCRLLPPEFREREKTLISDFAKVVKEVRPLDDGYIVLLQPDGDSVRLAAALIEAEAACCPFLQFCLIVTQETRDVIVELRGPPGSKEMLAEIFGWEVTASDAKPCC
ncbi:MAG: hypothetical protein ACREIA_19575 [Opitutaceae bacterium]